MMVQKRLWLALLFFALLVGACGSDDASYEEAPAAEPGSASEGSDDSFSEYDADTSGVAEREDSLNQGNQPSVQEQLIIRTGRLDIVVEDTEESLAAIAALVEGVDGWVVRSSVTQYDSGKSGTITIRVPSEQFADALNRIEAMALEVRSVSTESEDVTEEYVDLTARLGNLRATAERVRGFLDEANDVEEALAVNAELSRLEGEIEALEGRRQYLSQSASFSTITVNLVPDELSQPLEIGGWRPSGVARDAFETLVAGLQGLASVLIWGIIVLLPLALVILLPIGLLFFLLRRRRRRRTTSDNA